MLDRTPLPFALPARACRVLVSPPFSAGPPVETMASLLVLAGARLDSPADCVAVLRAAKVRPDDLVDGLDAARRRARLLDAGTGPAS